MMMHCFMIERFEFFDIVLIWSLFNVTTTKQLNAYKCLQMFYLH